MNKSTVTGQKPKQKKVGRASSSISRQKLIQEVFAVRERLNQAQRLRSQQDLSDIDYILQRRPDFVDSIKRFLGQ
jgi:hypothetical protein